MSTYEWFCKWLTKNNKPKPKKVPDNVRLTWGTIRHPGTGALLADVCAIQLCRPGKAVCVWALAMHRRCGRRAWVSEN